MEISVLGNQAGAYKKADARDGRPYKEHLVFGGIRQARTKRRTALRARGPCGRQAGKGEITRRRRTRRELRVSTLNPYRGWKSVFCTDGGAGDKRIRDNQAEARDGRPYTPFGGLESQR